MKPFLRPALVLAFSMVIAGCLHAPMPWSPDSKWIAYTVEVRPIDKLLRPGFLFESPTSLSNAPIPPSPPIAYRLWASRGDTGASVLLEESSQPLTAPGWSPDGRSLAFGRVVTDREGSGRFEVVVLEGPDRRRVIYSRPLPDNGVETTKLPGQAIVWSPDGHYLAIPQLNPLGLVILRADNGRSVNSIPDAFLPSWSPDGSHLAFIMRGTGDTLNCIDSLLGQPRLLAEVGQASQAPIWTRDGQTLLTVARKSVPRNGEPPGDQAELLRIRIDTGQTETLRSLTTDALLGRDRSIEGVSIAFDSEGEDLFCSTVVEGMPQQITWFRPRDNQVYKKFSIVDFTSPMGSLSVSPDGRTLAARIGSTGRLSPPALCDLQSTDLRSRLVAPDDASRVEWVATLLTSVRSILSSLPTASADPRVPATSRLNRPTLLPILGEFEVNSEMVHRLRRIGKMGRPLCDRPAEAPPAEPEVAILLDEARLLFDYLSENYSTALNSLETMVEKAETPDRRVRLLGIRAQIYIALGRVDRAGLTIDYLRSLERKPARGIEWTGTGYVWSGPEVSPNQEWPDYLAWRASAVRAILHGEGGENMDRFDVGRGNFNLDAVMPRANPVFPERPFDEPIPPGRGGFPPRPGLNREITPEGPKL